MCVPYSGCQVVLDAILGCPQTSLSQLLAVVGWVQEVWQTQRSHVGTEGWVVLLQQASSALGGLRSSSEVFDGIPDNLFQMC